MSGGHGAPGGACDTSTGGEAGRDSDRGEHPAAGEEGSVRIEQERLSGSEWPSSG